MLKRYVNKFVRKHLTPSLKANLALKPTKGSGTVTIKPPIFKAVKLTKRFY